MPTINNIADSLEKWAPKASALSYDNVGLQVGDKNTEVNAGLISLDLTPGVLHEAREKECQLIITHHPLIFKPIKQITRQTWHGNLVLDLAQSNIALYCIHTNLDLARNGVSFELARSLGLENISFLRASSDVLLKLVTFAPASHEEKIRKALGAAGAGHIGDYAYCAFTTDGTGHFKASQGANPYIGTSGGNLESVPEIRIEVQFATWRRSDIIQALLAAHPYEEVAYDLFKVYQEHTQTGMGAIGTLPAPLIATEFLGMVAKSLSTPGLRYVGEDNMMIQRVAVCGGSGSDLIPVALGSKADVLLTSDITYHKYFDVLDRTGHPKMMLIDAGHYETEAMTNRLLNRFLEEQFPGVSWYQTTQRTNPVRHFFTPSGNG